ncbi:Unknown protein [Striga hermonthica]|uniref:Uncharacterized protein n=1 Tax=Striga hermonthica TaxID=68872 RepID=A0A9N7MZ73_STRHE|nr:Unknown protein [Striga hermonthica]
MRPYTEEDISHEKCVPGPQIVPETCEISLKEFVQIPGNRFSALRTLFVDVTSLDVVDTTKIGRVLGLDMLEDFVFSHKAGKSWNEKFDLNTIVVIDGANAEIRAIYCDKFCEEATLNDFFSYICTIVELFRIEGFGLPAFFNRLINNLSNPPSRPSVCSQHQLEGFRHRLNGFWDCVLTTMALRTSSARAGLFTGIHKIWRFAPEKVRRALRSVLSSTDPPQITSDWRDSIAERGHPVLKKVLRYIPGDSYQNNKKAKEGEDPDRQFGLYEHDVGSLSVFPRQVNEHGSLR